ncbi:MAG: type II toxin-antitoxin system HicB family antitoxin [Treponema sp.]|nr:type II toxin-antitoxin system HicB family antitoxin [Treponema sp.]
MKNYIALFEQGHNNGYSVVFPDVPGVVTAGDSFDEAVRMAHEALAFHVEGLRTDGDPLPEPRSLEEIKADWEDWAEWDADGDFLVVPVALLPAPQKSVRVDAILPERLVARIDAYYKNRSAFLTAAAERYFEDKTEPIRKQG